MLLITGGLPKYKKFFKLFPFFAAVYG